MSRQPHRPLLIGCAAALLLGGGCLGYPVLKIRWSRRAVDAYCAEVAVGAPAAGLARKATEAWLDVIDVPARSRPDGTTEPAQIMVWQGWVFARRFCVVEHAGGRVTGKSSSSLD